jgi:hypothetical protein
MDSSYPGQSGSAAAAHTAVAAAPKQSAVCSPRTVFVGILLFLSGVAFLCWIVLLAGLLSVTTSPPDKFNATTLISMSWFITALFVLVVLAAAAILVIALRFPGTLARGSRPLGTTFALLVAWMGTEANTVLGHVHTGRDQVSKRRLVYRGKNT